MSMCDVMRRGALRREEGDGNGRRAGKPKRRWLDRASGDVKK